MNTREILIQKEILEMLGKGLTIKYFECENEKIAILADKTRIYVVPKKSFLIDLTKLELDENTQGLKKLEQDLNPCTLTNIAKTIDKNTIVLKFELDEDKSAVWVDKKLLKHFKNLEQMNYLTNKNVIVIQVNNETIAYIAPIRMDSE